MRQVTIVGLVTAVALVLRKRKESHERRAKRRNSIGVNSSLRVPGRHVVVVATASVPWMTGTAVNPTLRAAYLAKQTDLKVTLLTPWIAEVDQAELFKDNVTFATPEEQAKHIYAWVKSRTGFEPSFRLVFYPAEYFQRMLGIFPIGDPTKYIADDEADVAVLEEPEHLTWYHHGIRWVDKFPHVVGVMHTNYTELSRRTLGGPLGALVGSISHVMNGLLCSIHTHQIIKLSDAVQPLPRQATQFVHGAPGSFLAIGDLKSLIPAGGGPRFSKGAYTLGKMVWGKGWEELLDMLELQRNREAEAAVDCSAPHIDAFGSGEAEHAIIARAEEGGLEIAFLGRRDHLDLELREYRTFINASTSDVVATTSVEALAMGKWVLAARHPCNDFISAFRNCLIYESAEEFSAALARSAAEEPAPLSADDRYQLSWEAATERFLDAAELPEGRRPGPLVNLRDAAAFAAYNAYTSVESLRKLAGANADTGYNPEQITDVDHVARNAKREASRREADSGGNLDANRFFRNLKGSVSFSGLAGMAVGVQGDDNDSEDGERLSMERVHQESGGVEGL